MDNLAIIESELKAKNILARPQYRNIMCSISGGSDSDIILDLCERFRPPNKNIHYVFFDTGLEYQATKDHLDYLENKYNIKIERVRPKKTLPIAVKEYGQPFLSKLVSEYIGALQKYNFNFTDITYNEMLSLGIPKSYCNWWCNIGEMRSYSVRSNKHLKEFLILNPPKFKISAKCCNYTKKKTNKDYIKNNDIDLKIIGVRKSESGVRATAYKNCFSSYEDKTDEWRPVFYYTNNDKLEYKNEFNIKNSDCYGKYGLKRTGCTGCPFNRNIISELDIINNFEPKLYKASRNIFKDTYEYTKQFHEFQAERKGKPDKYYSEV